MGQQSKEKMLLQLMILMMMMMMLMEAVPRAAMKKIHQYHYHTELLYFLRQVTVLCIFKAHSHVPFLIYSNICLHVLEKNGIEQKEKLSVAFLNLARSVAYGCVSRVSLNTLFYGFRALVDSSDAFVIQHFMLMMKRSCTKANDADALHVHS